MIIIHPIDNFLFNLFPCAAGNKMQLLIPIIESFYTIDGIKPDIKVDQNIVTIFIDATSIYQQASDFKKIIALCEAGRFSETKPKLAALISQNRTNSEYHRIIGHVFAMLGNTEEAVNSLIYTLRWDRKNGYALIMMSNIVSHAFNDTDTAMKYYNEVLVQKPDDHLALNNIGSALLQNGKMQDGIDFLEKAYAANSDYPNTTYGLALAPQKQGETLIAFHWLNTRLECYCHAA